MNQLKVDILKDVLNILWNGFEPRISIKQIYICNAISTAVQGKNQEHWEAAVDLQDEVRVRLQGHSTVERWLLSQRIDQITDKYAQQVRKQWVNEMIEAHSSFVAS